MSRHDARRTLVVLADESPVTTPRCSVDASSSSFPDLATLDVFSDTDGSATVRDADGRVVGLREGFRRAAEKAGRVCVCVGHTRASCRVRLPLTQRIPAAVTRASTAAHPAHLLDRRVLDRRSNLSSSVWDELVLGQPLSGSGPPSTGEDVQVPLPGGLSLLWTLLVCKKGTTIASCVRSRCPERMAGCLSVLVVDAALGYFVWCYTVQSNSHLTDAAVSQIALTQAEGATYVDWLLGWPAGFKGNAQLNRVLGGLAKALLVEANPVPFVAAAVSAGAVWLGPALSAALGASGLLGLCADLLGLMCLNVRVGMLVFGVFFTTAKSVLVDLSRMLRGQRFNCLRHRTDPHSFDAQQKLVGALLFAVMFFLFPTVAAYFVFFLLWHTAVQCARDALFLAASLLLCFPYVGLLAYPLYRPSLPSLSLTLRPAARAADASACCVFGLTRNTLSPAGLLDEAAATVRLWRTHNPLRQAARILASGGASST
eukprot:Rhum_TRINITY_DN23670_c0_g1::Rhum_TRINITY_DN23670_c0_g1_i1::g.178529::m.178529/K03860/PIGQ, GPI1; phosphatidylinositol glycan, class Q